MVLSSGGFLGVEQGPSLGADLYIDALRRWPDHGRKYTILSNLPYILELNGRMEEAKAWADRYGREYPGNRNIRRAMQKDMNRAPQRRRN
jgi:hypothetical protein